MTGFIILLCVKNGLSVKQKLNILYFISAAIISIHFNINYKVIYIYIKRFPNGLFVNPKPTGTPMAACPNMDSKIKLYQTNNIISTTVD